MKKARNLSDFDTPTLITILLIALLILLMLSWLILVCLNTLGFIFPISAETILSVAGLILILRVVFK